MFPLDETATEVLDVWRSTRLCQSLSFTLLICDHKIYKNKNIGCRFIVPWCGQTRWSLHLPTGAGKHQLIYLIGRLVIHSVAPHLVSSASTISRRRESLRWKERILDGGKKKYQRDYAGERKRLFSLLCSSLLSRRASTLCRGPLLIFFCGPAHDLGLGMVPLGQ